MEEQASKPGASDEKHSSEPAALSVPPALMEFLKDRFSHLEASFSARFDSIEESLRSMHSRIDDTQRSIRKLRRTWSHEAVGPSTTTYTAPPHLSDRVADSLLPRKNSRAAIIKPSDLMIVSIPDVGSYSDTSSPGTPTTGRTPDHFLDLPVTPELLEQGIRPLQHYMRNALASRKLASMKEMAEERTFVAKELYDTEINYVQTLVTIQTVFMEPLSAAAESGKPILSKAEIRDLFAQIPVFLGINSEFLKVLTPLMSEWNPVTTQLGTVFLKNVAQFLKVYGAHIDSYSNQFNTIKALLSKNAEFAKFAAEAEAKPECKLQDLSLMMLTVVQRITRYKILLNALQKATWPEHIDYDNLVAANVKITETTMMVNEKKRESESLKRLLEIQSTLQGADEIKLLAPHRRYLTEMQGVWVPRGKPIAIYVFNDSVLIAKITKSGSQKLKQFCGLEGCRISAEPATSNLSSGSIGSSSSSSALQSKPRIRIDAPLSTYMVEFSESAKQSQFLEAFNSAKIKHREMLASSGTVNPRAMFNISHSSSSSGLNESFNSYRRRPGSLNDLVWNAPTNGSSSSLALSSSSSSTSERQKSSHLLVRDTSATRGSQPSLKRSPSASDSHPSRRASSSSPLLAVSPSSPDISPAAGRKASAGSMNVTAVPVPNPPSPTKSTKLPRKEKDKESGASASPKSVKTRKPVQRNLTDISLMRS